MDDVHFEVTSKLGKLIRVTKSRWDLIVKTKHPEIEGQESEAKRALREPDEIRRSRSDGSVFLYYRRQGRLSLAVVAKHNNGDGFIITAYFTDRIKEGERVYKRQK
ncbi:MAG: DUF4258 domain-containing protein [Acidobacteria bacterium]|nr:DUF4258 domain-containing protein [Acidobacteriota bacterium]